VQAIKAAPYLIYVVSCFSQDKCEPPVVVSDRRFMKAVQFLQVVAYSDGREQVLINKSEQW
jgi:MoxR-like ATPase